MKEKNINIFANQMKLLELTTSNYFTQLMFLTKQLKKAKRFSLTIIDFILTKKLEKRKTQNLMLSIHIF